MAKTPNPDVPENPEPQDTPAETVTQEAGLSLAHLESDEVVDPSTPVVDVPDEVKAFVDRAHAHWKEFPKNWRKVELHTETAVKDATRLARAFARQTGRVFRVKTTDMPTVLTYKVMDKSEPATEAADSDASATAEAEGK